MTIENQITISPRWCVYLRRTYLASVRPWAQSLAPTDKRNKIILVIKVSHGTITRFWIEKHLMEFLQ